MWATQRSAPRQALRLPLYFRILGDDCELIYSETANISQTGLFMPSRVRLKLGELLSLSVQIPTDISGSYRCYFHSNGAVVHEQPLSLGGVGYGVKFEGTLSARRLSSDPTEGIFKRQGVEHFREKRRNVRHALRLPATFRAPDVFPGIEMPAETLNISRYGVLLATPVMLKVGSPLSLLLNAGVSVPEGNITGERLNARVVHGSKLPTGALAYGVEIDQALPPIRVHHKTDAEVPIAWG